jgi:hypothetical protein
MVLQGADGDGFLAAAAAGDTAFQIKRENGEYSAIPHSLIYVVL